MSQILILVMFVGDAGSQGGGSGGGGEQILYISYVDCKGRDQCKKTLLKIDI